MRHHVKCSSVFLVIETCGRGGVGVGAGFELIAVRTG